MNEPTHPLPVVHRDLVEALEGSATGPGVDATEWAQKVSRALGDSSEAGARALGFQLAERYARSVVGRALMLSVELVSPERVWSTLLPMVSSRLRRNIQLDFRNDLDGGGHLVLRGPRATPAGMTVGVFEFLGSRTRPPTRVALVDLTEETLVVQLEWRR